MSMPVKLSIPTIGESLDPEVETRVVYVEEWVETLPFANPPVMMRNLLDAVSRLNRNPVKSANRLALMERYAKPYQYLVDLHEREESVGTLGAFERRRSTSDAARRIAIELAAGYKIVLIAATGKRSIFNKGKDEALALQRSVLFLCLGLLHSYDQYIPTPANLWNELWELSCHARQVGLEDQPAPGASLRADFQRPVGHLYRRILMTSLVDPYHLPQGDIWRVFGLLERYADAACLVPARELDKHTAQFIIDPASDPRPRTYAEAQRSGFSEQSQILDANPVIRALQAELKRDQSATPANRFLLGRIARSLGIPPKRHTPRESTGGQVRLASGISSLHHFLSGGTTALSTTSATRPEDKADIEIHDTSSDVPSELGPAYQTDEWEIVNQGPSGVGLLRRARPRVSTRVGELLGICFSPITDVSRDWVIGVVRWLNIADEGEYFVGVQVLSQQAQPVLARLVDVDNDGGGEFAALALPKVAAAKGATLLTPKGYHTKEKVLSLQTPGEMVRIRVGALVESTEVYDRFSYEILGQSK